MHKILFDLENQFFKLRYMSDRDWLDKVLHNDFHECGKSGILFDKKATVESLLRCDKDRDIFIYNFEYIEIGDGSWLVHYITKSDNKKYYRTSVWVMESGDLKLFFHQATELQEKINLKSEQ